MALVMPLRRATGMSADSAWKASVDVHVRHDLVARLDEIVGHRFGGDFGEAELSFGIDQAGVDGHAGGVDDLARRLGW